MRFPFILSVNLVNALYLLFSTTFYFPFDRYVVLSIVKLSKKIRGKKKVRGWKNQEDRCREYWNLKRTFE